MNFREQVLRFWTGWLRIWSSGGGTLALMILNI